MKRNTLFNAFLILLCMLNACKDEAVPSEARKESPILLSGEVEQVAVTRVNDSGFAHGDRMGIYVVDYREEEPGTLLSKGNRADNVCHTFDSVQTQWTAERDIYWKDAHTPIDIYGYYPYRGSAPETVTAWLFEVQKDQQQATTPQRMGGYEASDFLWGKATEVSPTDQVIRLPLRHRMSSPRITLKAGEGFAGGEWEKLTKEVLIANIARQAAINLADGSVHAFGKLPPDNILPFRKENEWRGIVVPQTVKAGTALFSITVGGTPYTFHKEEDFTYLSGKMHNFTLTVRKKADTGKYEFTLTDESISPWENDNASHDVQANEYIVIASKAGQLRECMRTARKDYKQLINLKLTGTANANDFYFMRDSMPRLEALNLKEVSILAKDGQTQANAIPDSAFYQKESLMRIILPDKLDSIGRYAFQWCTGMVGTLIIPEGVTTIQECAFYGCSFNGNLILPSTLAYIGRAAFDECKFFCELKLPESLTHIGYGAFGQCVNLYGDLILPSRLSYLGGWAFGNAENLNGRLVLPKTLKDIEPSTFSGCSFKGTLELPEGLTSIANSAFSSNSFSGELILPNSLAKMGEGAFEHCRFTTIELPKHLTTIHAKTFQNNTELTGCLEFPASMQTIQEAAFNNCRLIEELVFPEALEVVGREAFSGCTGVKRIISLSTTPPLVQSGAFDGIPKDNFTLEVPASAVQSYRTSKGWGEFKRIAGHHELVCRPAVAQALQTACQRKLMLNAEGEWEVRSLPEWCRLSQTGGTTKAELTLTIQALPQGMASRTGTLVFQLKGTAYTADCIVSQYAYQEEEDEIITLQKATRGNNGGINVVLLGDGFNAEDIATGSYLKMMKEQMNNLFDIEPYRSYRNYFNVYTALAVSTESGVGTANTIRYTKFNTTYTGGSGLKCDNETVFNYALRMPTVTPANLKQAIIIVVPNSREYGGATYWWVDGTSIAICPPSNLPYPFDTRGVLQHEAGGHAFGKLGDEYIYYNSFIYGHYIEALEAEKALGWCENLSLTGKVHEVPWKHLLYDARYSSKVDVFEGGFGFSRGVFRSEANSCMNNNVPYYNAISREAIVKRIKQYAGEAFSFEEFVRLDQARVNGQTRAATYPGSGHENRMHHAPQILEGSPTLTPKH